ncbi:MAG: aspartyl/asparaginyl beta-hydroxylase domain-containing protein [Chitinophagales bacterium]|nr:aspartyl/asparaginyl beta-hydroxylase domain-containing protein [Chitinophagales bacterium]
MNYSAILKREPIYFNLYGNWYKGKLPSFVNVENTITTKLLKDNFEEIRDEIIDYYNSNRPGFEPMYVPHNYHNINWQVLNFYGFTLKNIDNINKFPKLNSVLKQIPNMVGAQISVLNPNTRIKAHISGSNALLRYHLGIFIPGKYPDLGIRVRTENKCWEEGGVFAFSESHRHFAWNNTDKHRIVLLVDTVHPDYVDKKTYLCAASLAIITMKMFTTKFPRLKDIPIWLTKLLFNIFIIPFYFLFFLQEKFGIDISKIASFLKFKKR